jgi:creatinine amidohydrolase
MPGVQYEELLPHEIVAARRARPLAYLPIGTVEWHGVHNATGLDTLKAHRLCVLAAEAGGGLVLPPLWYGEHREIQLMEANPASREAIAGLMDLPPESFGIGTMNGATVDAQAHAYNDLLFHIYDQVAALGFSALIVLCGHYPLQLYTDYTTAVFMRRSPMRVFAATEAHFVRDLAQELGARVGDHAAKWETSLLMALRPGLTDLSRLPPAGERVVGVGGEDPRQANEDLGRRAVQAIVERMVQKGEELLETG